MIQNTIFFAYTKKNKDNVYIIQKAISQYNNPENKDLAISWEDLKISGKIINKTILNEINRRSIFACDLTYLNNNVLFELGYAIGKNKKILIFLNTNIINAQSSYENFEVLRNFGYKAYKNSNDIISEFPPDRVQRDFLKDVIKFDKSEINTFNLFLIKGEIENPTSSELLELIKSLHLTIISDDSYLEYQTLEWYLNNINKAKNIIILLKGSDVKDKNKHNAAASLFAGLSYGLGKTVLLLAPKSFRKPIDYENILIKYEDPFDCIEKTKNWLNNYIIDSIYYNEFMDEISFINIRGYYEKKSDRIVSLKKLNFFIDKEKYSMEKSISDLDINKIMDEYMELYKEIVERKGISCFNGTVSRLKEFIEKSDNEIDIKLQEVKYFDYIKCHLMADYRLNKKNNYKSFRDYISSRPELYLELARPLGINILLLNKNDNSILLQKRSKKINIYPNTIYPTASGSLQFNDALLLSQVNKKNEEIKKIILSREVYEETGILPSNIYNLEFIGYFEDTFRLNIPDIFFLGWTDINSDIFIKKYNKGDVKDKFESDELITCKINDLFSEVFTNNFEEHIAQTLKIYLSKKNTIRDYLKNNSFLI